MDKLQQLKRLIYEKIELLEGYDLYPSHRIRGQVIALKEVLKMIHGLNKEES